MDGSDGREREGAPGGHHRTLPDARGPEPGRELDEEIAYHIGRVTDELVARGLAPDEARREAERRFGDVAAYRAKIRGIDRRRRWRMTGRQRFETLGQHVAQAARTLVRAPGFSAGVIVTLALGIGVNATVFGLVDRLLLSPPPGVVDADQVALVHVERVSPFTGQREVSSAFSYPDYRDLDGLPELETLAAFGASTATLGRGAEAERIRVETASAGYFELLGVRPRLGRFFTPDEDRIEATARPPAVLSHAFWVRRYGADPDVLGTELDLGSGLYTVVGVAPEGFSGAKLTPVDVWLPMLPAQTLQSGGTSWEDARGWYWLEVVARLGPGVSREAAASAVTRAHRTGRREMMDAGRYDAEARAVLGSLIAAEGPDPGQEVQVTRWLAGVALVVLLVACANVANLLLVRAIRRRRELAVRLALGMGRGRLTLHLMAESVLLAALAGGAALLAAAWAGRLLHRTLLTDVALDLPLLETRTIVFTLAATALAALLAGGLPALRGSKLDLQEDLKAGGRAGVHRSPLRSALLAAQSGLSVLLLVGAGLFVRSLHEARNADIGYDPDAVVIASLVMDDGSSYGASASEAGERAAERLRGLPGVRVATSGLAPQMGLWGDEFRITGRDSITIEGGGPFYYSVSPGYLSVLGTGIERGRDLEASDMAPGAEPVAIVTRRLARLAWSRDDVVGECMFVGPADEDPPCTRVVGVAEDQRVSGIADDWSPVYFLPGTHPRALSASGGRVQSYILLVRDLDGDASDRVEQVRETILAAAPDVRFANVRTYRDVLEPQARPWRLGATLFTIFGALALGVAAVGLYSLVSFQVAERRRELGIRAALGGGAVDLVGLVARQALGLTALGLILGSLVALLAGRALAGVLFEVSPDDPRVYLVVAGVLLVVAAAAATLPAVRAGRLDPSAVLRLE